MGRARLTTRRLVLFALLEAILVGLQVVMAAFPNIEAVSLLTQRFYKNLISICLFPFFFIVCIKKYQVKPRNQR